MTNDRYEADLRCISTSVNDAELAESELDVLGVGENDGDPEDNGDDHTDDMDETLLCDIETGRKHD